MKMTELKVGDKGEYSKTITETDVNMFATVTTDINPLHMNEQFAQTTPYKTRLAHGAINAGLISALIGTVMPGSGYLYLSQETKYRRPTYIGETITVKAEVVDEKIEGGRTCYDIKTDCYNQAGEAVTFGLARVTRLPAE
jgi:3-hydroxybutyryl-CoA dehydratase